MTVPVASFSERQVAQFWARVDVGRSDDCWPWTGCLDHSGYGHVVRRLDGRQHHMIAHRLAYALWNGDRWPRGHVLHTCHNPRCCNPAHLREGSHADNMREKSEAGRATSGHPHMTSAEKRRLVQLDRRGYGLTRIARALGRDRANVRRWRDRLCTTTRAERADHSHVAQRSTIDRRGLLTSEPR